MKVLVINAGSSSLKFSLIESNQEVVLCEGAADWSCTPARFTLRRPGMEEVRSELTVSHHGEAVVHVLQGLTASPSPILGSLSEIMAVGHRVVHGGSVYTASVLVTSAVKQTLVDLSELAPLHNPANLEGITAVERALPGVPQVAVFDTAFHATIAEPARVYPLPYSWYRDWGLRRYGFHGLSHAYCTSRAAQMLQRPATELRLIICHLGNGCSISAVSGGKCVDTSMGFTPLEGLMMGTRSGSVDPGLLLHVLRRKGLTADQLDEVLNHQSGLLGVSGVSFDMRQVLAAAASGNEQARIAVVLYVHRIKQTIGAMAVTMRGVDALVFTAGVGENATLVRDLACAGLNFLGLELDLDANATCQPDADVAASSSRGRILVIRTREDLTILRETVQVVEQQST